MDSKVEEDGDFGEILSSYQDQNNQRPNRKFNLKPSQAFQVIVVIRRDWKALLVLVVGVLLIGAWAVTTYRQSLYNYVGSKPVEFYAQVQDEDSPRGHTYQIPAVLRYDSCAANYSDTGCYPGVLAERVNWPDGGYTTFRSCVFRDFNKTEVCRASNGEQHTYDVKILNKKVV